jgi:TIR domain
MPYLAPHFDPDVFVSYSHGDPVGGSAPLRDWTQALIHRLRDQLRSLETDFKELHLWMDAENDPTAKLTDELRKTVSRSGVLMIVMSKHYLDSKWCGDELEWFRKQIEARPGESGRVFVLRAQETDIALWPEFLRDERGHVLPGFSFYDPQNGYPWDYPDLRAPSAGFCKELLKLQIWLVKRLRELRERAAKQARDEAAVAAPLPTAASSRRIYLHAPPDSESARIDIGRALESDGIMPLTAEIAAGKGVANFQREAQALRIEAAKRCEALALLPVNTGGGFVGDLLDIGVDERKRVSDARGAPMPCAVLDKTGERLPIPVAQFGIERFDINAPDWGGQFRSWLDAARGRPAEAGA